MIGVAHYLVPAHVYFRFSGLIASYNLVENGYLILHFEKGEKMQFEITSKIDSAYCVTSESYFGDKYYFFLSKQGDDIYFFKYYEDRLLMKIVGDLNSFFLFSYDPLNILQEK